MRPYQTSATNVKAKRKGKKEKEKKEHPNQFPCCQQITRKLTMIDEGGIMTWSDLNHEGTWL